MSCPICEKETVPNYKPFCSKRCADVDLAKWLNGSYALASDNTDDAEALFEAMEDALHERAEPNREKLH